jgi:hypothetical protein
LSPIADQDKTLSIKEIFMIKLFIAILMLGVSAEAALPPQWDQVKKFEAVLASHELIQDSQAGIVKSITEVKENVFAVAFDKYSCTYLVTLAANRPSHPGPTTYTVKEISQPTCERP